MKTLIEIHVLQNFAPSNLNRDDTGAPKDAIFGGTRRARVSSQCIKKSVRNYFATCVEQEKLTSDDIAVRTKRIVEALVAVLVEKGRVREEAVMKVTTALAALELTVKEDGKTQYLLFLGRREIEGAVAIIHEKWDAISTATSTAEESKKPGKSKKKAASSADPELKAALEKIFNGGLAVDVALFGRMLADMPEKNQNAACQVAHAISTHVVDREFDYFTAVDDLKPDDTAGADMIGTVEFNSACFYRYAVVDWDKLISNLQTDKDLAVKGLRAFIEGFVVAEPTGKQNTFAAHNPPEFVAISVRKNTGPRSLANAFESAVFAKKTDSLTAISAEKLVETAKMLQLAYGGEDSTFVLNLVQTDVSGFGITVPSFNELLNKTVATLER